MTAFHSPSLQEIEPPVPPLSGELELSFPLILSLMPFDKLGAPQAQREAR